MPILSFVYRFRLWIVVGAFVLLAAPSWGQNSAVKPRRNPKVVWRKYVNNDYNFSFWYPPTYRPTKFLNECEDTYYRKCLVYLRHKSNPDASILVTLIVPPFSGESGAGGTELARQRIGDYEFYCGLGGSMGTQFSDVCIFNLHDKRLEFSFVPDSQINAGWKTNSLSFRMIKTFRAP